MRGSSSFVEKMGSRLRGNDDLALHWLEIAIDAAPAAWKLKKQTREDPMVRKFLLRGLVAFSLTMVAVAVHAAPTQWSGNDHWYDAIAGTQNWDEANLAAQGSVFMGMTGHLAT